MSLYDRIMPSERAAELGLVVRRIRRHTGYAVIPMLVVEGPSDESLFGVHCRQGPRQVFAAGTRGLVEQLVGYLRANPIAGCECVFLTDCDGYGKTPYLRDDRRLIVTAGCDAEADLVAIGVVGRVTSGIIRADASAVVQQAVDMSLPLSILRRRASRAAITMKKRHRRLRLIELPPVVLARWAGAPPTVDETIEVVSGELAWSPAEIATLHQDQSDVSPTFERSGSGKDVLDALFFLLGQLGVARGMHVEAFHKQMRCGLQLTDLPEWEVGRRLAAWQREHGLVLIPDLK